MNKQKMQTHKKCKQCQKYNTYNEKTLRAIEESSQGIGINEYSSIEEIINKIKNYDESD